MDNFLKIIKYISITLVFFYLIDLVGFRIIRSLQTKVIRGYDFSLENSLNQVSADLLFIGASQCTGNYIPKLFSEKLNIGCFNAGLGGQHIDYQILTTNRLIKRKLPKFIIWDFDPKLFSNDNGVFFKEHMNAYYGLDPSIDSVLTKLNSNIALKNLVKSYRYNSKLFQYIYFGTGEKERTNGYNPYKCKINYEIRIQDSIHYPPLGSDSERKMKLMGSTLKKWSELGIKVYIIVSPIYRKIIYPIYSLEIVENIAHENNANYLNLSQLDGIYNNSIYFRDEIHLCEKGAERYSEFVLDSIFH